MKFDKTRTGQQKGRSHSAKIPALSAVFLLAAFTFAGMAEARSFMVYNTSAPAQAYFIVNGTTGNVGINTTNPISPLMIYNSNVPQVIVDNSAGSNASFIRYSSGGASRWAAGMGLTAPGDYYQIYSYAIPDAVMTIKNNGNVGIGTTGPGARLDVKGTGAGAQKVNIQDPYGGSFAFDMQGSGVTSRAAIYVDSTAIANTEVISIPTYGATKGYIGIGTTAPSSLLELNNSAGDTVFTMTNGATGTSNVDALLFRANSSAQGSTGWVRQAGGYASASTEGPLGMSLWNVYNAPIIFSTSNAEKMRITGAGNVGIGTTNPLDALHVNGGIRSSASASDYNTGDQVTLDWNQGNARLNAQKNSGGSANISLLTQGITRIFINGVTGYVGIGTATPSGTFHASGTIYFTNEGTTASAANVYTDPTTGQVFRSTSSARYKDNIRNLEVDSSLIYKLVPRTFESKSDGKTYFGLVAEEVNQHIPQLVQYDSQGRPDSVAYPMLSTLMLPEMKKMSDAVKEQQKEIGQLKSIVCQDHPGAGMCGR